MVDAVRFQPIQPVGGAHVCKQGEGGVPFSPERAGGGGGGGGGGGHGPPLGMPMTRQFHSKIT